MAIGGYFAGPWLMTQYFYLTSDKAPDGYQVNLNRDPRTGPPSSAGGMSMGGPGDPQFSDADAYSDDPSDD